MSLWKKFVMAGVAATVIMTWAGIGSAQEQNAAGRGQRRTGEQMRQRMLERMKETLGAKDEEWAVIAPKIEKINTLRNDMVVQRTRGGEPAVEEGEVSAMRKATQELQSILNDSKQGMPVTPEQITEKVTAFREAREKSKQEIAATQAELKELLTVEQEAVLVLQGILE